MKWLFKKNLHIENDGSLLLIYFENSPIDNIKYFTSLVLKNKVSSFFIKLISFIGSAMTLYSIIYFFIDCYHHF